MKTQHTPRGYPAISVSRKQIEAALLFAAKKGARYYLCGVWVGKGPHGGALLAATDGHHAAVINTGKPYPDTLPPGGFILGRDRAALAVKGAGKEALIELAPGRVGHIGGAGTDAQYPDVLRMIPATVSGELAHFDPALLFAFRKARRVLCGQDGGFVAVGHNGASAARVAIGDPDFVGVVMPLRFRHPQHFDLPEWRAPAPAAVNAAA